MNTEAILALDTRPELVAGSIKGAVKAAEGSSLANNMKAVGFKPEHPLVGYVANKGLELEPLEKALPGKRSKGLGLDTPSAARQRANWLTGMNFRHVYTLRAQPDIAGKNGA